MWLVKIVSLKLVEAYHLLLAVSGVERRGERIPASDNFGDLKSICCVARSGILARIGARMSGTVCCRVCTKTHDVYFAIEGRDGRGRFNSATPYLVIDARRSNLVAAAPWRRPLYLPDEDMMTEYPFTSALHRYFLH